MRGRMRGKMGASVVGDNADLCIPVSSRFAISICFNSPRSAPPGGAMRLRWEHRFRGASRLRDPEIKWLHRFVLSPNIPVLFRNQIPRQEKKILLLSVYEAEPKNLAGEHNPRRLSSFLRLVFLNHPSLHGFCFSHIYFPLEVFILTLQNGLQN